MVWWEADQLSRQPCCDITRRGHRGDLRRADTPADGRRRHRARRAARTVSPPQPLLRASAC